MTIAIVANASLTSVPTAAGGDQPTPWRARRAFPAPPAPRAPARERGRHRTGPRQTYGDELSDAQAQAKALAAKVAAQKAQLAKLQALQSDLNDDIAQTKSHLAGVNADLSAVKAKVAATGAQVAAVRAAYNALVTQIDELDAQPARIATAEMVKSNELTERKAILAARLRDAYDRPAHRSSRPSCRPTPSPTP